MHASKYYAFTEEGRGPEDLNLGANNNPPSGVPSNFDQCGKCICGTIKHA
jgi:hypothetical protein